MKKLINAIFAIAILLGGISTNRTIKIPQAINATQKLGKALSDEDPIILHGHVKNTSGGGIAAASIKLRIPGTTTEVYSTTADSNGDYEIDSVAQGSYGMRIAATGYVTKTFDVTFTSNVTRTDTLVAQ